MSGARTCRQNEGMRRRCYWDSRNSKHTGTSLVIWTSHGDEEGRSGFASRGLTSDQRRRVQNDNDTTPRRSHTTVRDSMVLTCARFRTSPSHGNVSWSEWTVLVESRCGRDERSRAGDQSCGRPAGRRCMRLCEHKSCWKIYEQTGALHTWGCLY